ncbi:MAG TPA: double zinc ribbon domain-containing protein, partial [Usitatibacteraceae bacterium]|nr:double zinc ribbon domain-containing protein [Usitatibacteraceae bacterium]
MLRLFRDLGLQQDCTLCDARSSGLLCPSCRADLPRADAPACARCAIGLPVPGVCGACLQDPPAFDEAIAAFRYGFPLDRIVQALKFSRELALAGLLAEALAVAVRA